jgi:hypothetical protein
MDTSTLNGLARDLSSSAAELTGKRFVNELSVRGYVPVISFENILELLRHKNGRTVNDRIAMFAVFPQVAHVDALQRPGEPGTIVDILAREVKAYLSDKASDVATIARSVRSSLFGFCDGRKIEKWLNEKREEYRPLAQGSHQREKLLSSVSHVALTGTDKVKVGSIPPNSRVDQATIERYLRRLQSEMEANLREHGVEGLDKAYSDDFAAQFVADQGASFSRIAGPDGAPAFARFRDEWLRERRIDPIQVSDRMTIYDLAEMSAFSRKLKLVSHVLGLAEPVTVRDIPMDKCPSEIVQTGVERCRRSAPRAQGGDLIDSYRATLACYCDITIVDKRTKEYIRQLRTQNNLAKALIRKVVCLSTYTDFLSEESLPTSGETKDD